MSEDQVFEKLLDLNKITKDNGFEDGRNYIDGSEETRRFLGVPISAGKDKFQMREIMLDGVKYFLEGRDYITRDAKDGRVVKLFVCKGVMDANGQFLFRDEFDWIHTEFGEAYEVDYWQKIFKQSWLKDPSSIAYRAKGYEGEPFYRMWDDEPYPEGYEWPEDLSVFGGGIHLSDGVDWELNK